MTDKRSDRRATTLRREDGTWRGASMDPKRHWRVNTTEPECDHRHREHRAALDCATRKLAEA